MKKSKKSRRCTLCGRILSIYNRGAHCFFHSIPYDSRGKSSIEDIIVRIAKLRYRIGESELENDFSDLEILN